MLNQNKLGRDSRLKTTSFVKVYEGPRRFRHNGISLLVRENELTFSRIGITIAKKQVPQAVDRNRIRRINREFFRLHRQNLPVALDMVVLAYAPLLELNNEEIRACLNILWAKLNKFFNKV